MKHHSFFLNVPTNGSVHQLSLSLFYIPCFSEAGSDAWQVLFPVQLVWEEAASQLFHRLTFFPPLLDGSSWNLVQIWMMPRGRILFGDPLFLSKFSFFSWNISTKSTTWINFIICQFSHSLSASVPAANQQHTNILKLDYKHDSQNLAVIRIIILLASPTMLTLPFL